MNENSELSLLKQVEQLQEEMRSLKGLDSSGKLIYQYTKIRDVELEKVVDIEKKLDMSIFNDWFNFITNINDEDKKLFKKIIENNELLVDDYSEEDLKVNVIIPILNQVEFKSFKNEFRDFYELSMRYETDKFIFSGTTDFVVSKGLVKSKKPFFFIQEFKRSEEYGNPRPQLLAELISGVELNKEIEIKGAYIIGAVWHFVILRKLDTNKYEYFVSKSFDSMDINKLEAIYKNLLFIKNEIVQKIEKNQ